MAPTEKYLDEVQRSAAGASVSEMETMLGELSARVEATKAEKQAAMQVLHAAVVDTHKDMAAQQLAAWYVQD